MPHVAGFMPTLNEEDSITDTLLSLDKQTHEIEKLFIVDGGSTDGTLDIIDNVRDELHFEVDVQVIEGGGARYSSHKGAKAAADYLMEEHDGGVIVRAEADSRLTPLFVEHAVEQLARSEVTVFGAKSMPHQPDVQPILKKLCQALSNIDRLPKGRGMAFTAEDFLDVDGYMLPDEDEISNEGINCYGDVVITEKLREKGKAVMNTETKVYTTIPSTSMSSADRIINRLRLEAKIGPTENLWSKIVPVRYLEEQLEEMDQRLRKVREPY